MNRSRLCIPIACSLLAGLSAGAVASAQDASSTSTDADRRVLIDRELNASEITLLSITEEAIAYIDEQGRSRRASIGGLVALLPLDQDWGAAATEEAPLPSGDSAIGPDPMEQPPASGVLELADGQRLPGEYASTGGDEDSIVWSHPVFGRLAINLDRVAHAVLRDANRNAGATTRTDSAIPSDQDQLILANGDRITGFVISMGDPIEIEVGDDIFEIPAERVSSVRLANPPAAMNGLVVWLDDGSVVVVAAIDGHDGESIELALPSGQTGVFPVDSLDAVAFRAGRLQGLASMEPITQAPLGERYEGQPTRILNDPVYQSSGQLRAPDIEIPGPMRIEWNIPEGARRFATIAEMPFDAIPWGDCVLSVHVDSIEQASQRINADNPRFEINIPIEPGARTLTISVDPGAWGPINDRITLRRPLLLHDNEEL